MTEKKPLKLGTYGAIQVPLTMPNPLAHSDTTLLIFRTNLIQAIERAMQSGELAALLKEHDVTVTRGKRATFLNEATGDQLPY